MTDCGIPTGVWEVSDEIDGQMRPRSLKDRQGLKKSSWEISGCRRIGAVVKLVLSESRAF